ncbi:DNA-binding SARP family transcriptional activator [Actinoalloteichus hoggarensis]|uniref:Regulatory protein AfsR n=1 Tax=Actinoalloteichus hoggarensis TaxID=1470176 RepID=A0A221W1U1_9PSEU|nr:BTAD domain-containing putative transcriptional regulator [Actinoalloteichus hoggarensis]ASO19679.1 Regulatory protein AfsR [Actinoalloteichus hoggarensis]MBB5919614.1 DNA-binding SARP family transcriptional activator [Actinoalloteichus hoggarensis]
MQVHVLGPFEVLRDGRFATPSAPKLRQVLALLVTHANSIVRTDQIIEELWEDHPPKSVTTTLQTYVYQLRKLLRLSGSGAPAVHRNEPLAEAVLLTSPSGYLLGLPPDAMDSHRFEQLAERGRAEFEAGSLAEAADTLGAALKLWRGPALIDVSPGPVLQAEVVRLDEIRKNALERRIDSALSLGRHRELLGELTTAVTREPTHEGFQARLMLALYRSGRRSDALQVYQRARKVLADELGLDPSSELQKLHAAVLSADPALEAPRIRETVRASPQIEPPAELPSDMPAIVGREASLTTALQALTSPERKAPPVVVGVGAPGTGKSAFCVHAAHLVRSDYPDGQLYAQLLDPRGEPVDLSEVLAHFLRALGVAPTSLPRSLEERSQMFRGRTAGRRVLVVLDDLVSAEQLLRLKPSGSGCAVLAASRRRLSHPMITTTLEMTPLNVGDSLQLLGSTLGAHRIAGEIDAVHELVELCEGMPLALHASASRLRLRPHWSITRLVEWVRREQRRGPELAVKALELSASIEQTYRLASPAVRTAFRLVSILHEQPVSPQAAAAVLRCTEFSAESLLEELVEFRLCDAEPAAEEPGGFRYRFPTHLRAAAGLLELAPEHDEVFVPSVSGPPAQRAASPRWAPRSAASEA